MVERAGPITLVSLEVDEPVLTGHTAFGHITFSGLVPDGISVEVVSSNPNVLKVENSPVGGDPGTHESFLVLLSPERPGTAVLTATFGNSVQAEVTVEKDPKEGKEGKEGREKGKEHTGKELEVTRAYGSPAMIVALTAAGNLDSDGQAGSGRAFIRSDERPALRLPVNLDKRKSAGAGHPRQPL